MRPLSVVVFQKDPHIANALAQSLGLHFRLVNVAHDFTELRQTIPHERADVAVVDLEFAGLNEIRELHKEFASVTLVCTHRLADEKMWSLALAAGACDCCASSDVRAIVLAATSQQIQHHAA